MKVLIISHNPVSHQSNMGKTFLSLFSGFGKEALCQLYIYPVIPDVDRCGSYYRVTDKEALRSRFRPGTIGGEVDKGRIRPDQEQYENRKDRRLYRDPRNKSALRRLLRDAVWHRADWYNAGLRKWLDREQPTCIFVAPGAAGFLYDMALKIAGERKLPIVTYLCDEFYFLEAAGGPLERYRLQKLRKKMEQLLASSRHLAVISHELEAAYRVFGRPTTVLMTGAEITPAKQTHSEPGRNTVCYFGNVRCGRCRPLGDVAAALEKINRRQGTRYRLKVYTAERDEKILAYLAQFPALELAGYVTGAEYEQSLKRAGVLLHVESFEPDCVERVKHSVSTKIADYLASGVPVVAYGPEGIASMAHLKRWDCAFSATEPERLEDTLLRALTDAERRRTVAENGLRAAEHCHDREAVSNALREILG